MKVIDEGKMLVGFGKNQLWIFNIFIVKVCFCFFCYFCPHFSRYLFYCTLAYNKINKNNSTFIMNHYNEKILQSQQPPSLMSICIINVWFKSPWEPWKKTVFTAQSQSFSFQLLFRFAVGCFFFLTVALCLHLASSSSSSSPPPPPLLPLLHHFSPIKKISFPWPWNDWCKQFSM